MIKVPLDYSKKQCTVDGYCFELFVLGWGRFHFFRLKNELRTWMAQKWLHNLCTGQREIRSRWTYCKALGSFMWTERVIYQWYSHNMYCTLLDLWLIDMWLFDRLLSKNVFFMLSDVFCLLSVLKTNWTEVIVWPIVKEHSLTITGFTEKV